MKHVDPITLAELGIWRDFPPQSRLRRVLMRMADHCGLWITRIRTRRALADLDNRLLRDVGLTRYDAARETARPFWKK